MHIPSPSSRCRMSEEGLSKHPSGLLSSGRDAQQRKRSPLCPLQPLRYLHEVLTRQQRGSLGVCMANGKKALRFFPSLKYFLVLEDDLLISFPPSPPRVCSISLLIKFKCYINKDQLCFAKEGTRAVICMGFIQDRVYVLNEKQFWKAGGKKGLLELPRWLWKAVFR